MTQEITEYHDKYIMLTAKDVATQLKISYRRVLKLIKSGELPAYVIAGMYRIKSTHLRIYIDDRDAFK